MSKEYPWGKGTIARIYDATANDSDKSFTTPAGKVREYFWIKATIAATATVGNRQMKLRLTDGTNTLFDGQAANVAASGTGIFLWIMGTSSSTQTSNSSITNQYTIPRIIAPGGYVVRVWDEAAVDAAADDLTITGLYVEYDA